MIVAAPACIASLKKETKKKQKPIWKTEDLWNADPKCKHKIVDAKGGGIKCTKCAGWFCY
jgi:hypothetical protein